jgi:hypothetical protein
MINKNNYEIILSNEADYGLFNNIVKILKNDPDIKLIKYTDGLDEKYYDFKFQDKEFCLHLQHYLGIVLITNNLRMKIVLKRIADNIVDKLA